MEKVREDLYTVDNSEMVVTIISDLDWEDIVVLKSQAMIRQLSLSEEEKGLDLDPPIRRDIKDWLIKGI
jgi:hypothetical protein